MRRGFSQTNVMGDHCLTDFVAEMFPNFSNHIARQLGSGIEHGADNGADAQSWIEITANEVDVAKQLTQALKGVILALDGHDYFVCGREPIHGQQTQRRRAVDQHIVKLVDNRSDRFFEAGFPAHDRHQFDFSTRQVQV